MSDIIKENNNLQIINSQEVLGKTFTIYGTFENPLFLAKDVANWIEHSDAAKMVEMVDSDEKVLMTNPNNVRSGGQNAWFLTENGLYEVLMLSRKPIAKDFKREVKRILHDLRVGVSKLVPTNLKDALLLAYQQQCKIEEQQEQLESQKPLVEFANSVATSSNSISVGDFAKIIYNDFKLGQKQLFEVLRQQGFLMKTNVPYQRYIDNGCFEIMEGTFNTSYGKRNYTKTLITGKGQIYLVEKLKELKLISTKGETK